ncbi:hypothetical protein AXF42_Ash010703 [Apostasia shenzhenica]|uniref:Uncharacterized protein n=1 Tax=Apostasia shenzhenica TaxID=1088818 RepID=A0A2I0A6T9_9ASPA|nr:hypothetical protein AXF42_Ash010703 [Apostasia shenzhenica]
MDDISGDCLSSDLFRQKIPSGDSPYVRAKHVQLVEKDPNRAIALFWSAINSGDRVDSALKDMAVVMKQVNRAEEAIEAIRSFRGLCTIKAQEPLDNVLLDLYKKCGRMAEQIDLLSHKLRMIDEGIAFGGRITKTARSQGKKFHVTVDQEKSRLLGNLAWAYMQSDNYTEAEPLYRKALEIEKDYNKMCNLAICLMQTGRLSEAKSLLLQVKKPFNDFSGESYQKSFERAWELMNERSSSASKAVKAASPSPIDGSSRAKTSSVEAGSPSPLTVSGICVERKKTDGESENLVIRLDIHVNRPKRKKNVEPTTPNVSTEVHGGSNRVQICFGSLNQEIISAHSAGSKKTWADMVEEEEAALVAPPAAKSGRRSWADIVEEEEGSVCTSWSKNDEKMSSRVEGDRREEMGGWRGTPARKNPAGGNGEERRRSSWFDRSPGCDLGRWGKMRNRLQVFREITPGDAKV